MPEAELLAAGLRVALTRAAPMDTRRDEDAQAWLGDTAGDAPDP